MKKTNIRRPRITEDTKKVVTTLFQQGLSVGQIFQLRKKQGLRYPSLRSLQTIVTQADDIASSPAFQKQERLWHLELLSEHPEISTEAVAKIFELKAKGLPYLTVRTAQWISRLVALPLSIDVLYVFAWVAAYEEKIFDLANLPRDTDTLTFETFLLAALKNPDKARWTVATWEQPLSDAPEFRQKTQEVLLKFYPIYISPTLEELKGTLEYERWKAGYYSKENQKILKRMRQQQWERNKQRKGANHNER